MVVRREASVDDGADTAVWRFMDDYDVGLYGRLYERTNRTVGSRLPDNGVWTEEWQRRERQARANADEP